MSEPVLCGVCYTEICPQNNPRGTINSCSHAFCAYCINQWAKETNVCPQCRARFTRITVVDHATGEEAVTKIRRRNYKGWEQQGSESEDSADEEMAAARRASRTVSCSICRSSESAITMLCCDRRTCSFIAHLECLGLAEAPPVFVCPGCSGGPQTPTATESGDGRTLTPNTPVVAFRTSATPVRFLMDEDIIEAVAPTDADPNDTKRPEARPAAPPPPPRPLPPPTAPARRVAAPARSSAGPPPPPVAAAVAVAVTARTVVEEVPYWMQPPEHVQEPLEFLRRKKEHAAYVQQLRESAPAAARAKRPREAGPTQPAGLTKDELAAMERNIRNSEFQASLQALRVRSAAEEASLRLDFYGNIVARAPLSRGETAAREDALRAEAMRIAEDTASRRVASIAAAQNDATKRLLERRAAREAIGLAKLAEMIAARRKVEVGALKAEGEDVKVKVKRE